MISREHRELARELASFPAFADCLPDDLLALARAGRVTSLPARWTFVHEGTPADACYVLLDGQAHVRMHGEERARLGPGAVLGEMALLGRRLRAASVSSATPVRALRVEYADLVALLASRPRLEASLGAVYAEHRAADAGAAGSTPSVT
jgi:CRP-like cAMP-binding protein